tara:strand:- start:787 stop:2238 length:1452 start_codon:yes stop_codon:yes gene_type:complete
MTSSLTRDFTATPTNAKKFTVSFWLRKCKFSSNQIMMCNYGNSGNDDFQIQLRNDETLGILDYKGGSVVANHETTRKFQDPVSWYHIVIAGDSTQSTAADRLKLYINGVQETEWASLSSISQNTDFNWNKETSGTSIGHVIGKSGGGSNIFNGYLAHIHNVDGTAYAPTTFGETDSTTGEWKPILNPSVTYGNNGWFLKFENAGALGTDSSGNSATFTVSGDLKQSISTPSNLFCTLDYYQSYQTNINDVFKNAATTWADGNSSSADGYKGSVGTLATTKGKWYFEVKHVEGMYSTAGISKASTKASAQTINTHYKSPFYAGDEGDGFGFQMGTQPTLIQRGDSTEAQWYQSDGSTNITSFSNGDICMIAYDLDAGKIWWGKNGTWLDAPGTSNTGNPATGANAHKTWTANGEFFRPAVSVYQRTYGSSGANPNTVHCNFGEGRFGTTAVSSGNADGAGMGSFEYAPPSGFYAVCTKNIKTYG